MIPVSAAGAPVAVARALNGESWKQAGELGLALVLSAAIGLEREIRQKNAGLRTHTLVGVGAALFVLISKYGFTDVLEPRLIVLDPSRMAAQIVTGVGFLGAGLIFVRRDSVRGLNTAAAIWVTAGVGSAAAAGLPVLAVLTTAIYFLVAVAFPVGVRRLPVGHRRLGRAGPVPRWSRHPARGGPADHGQRLRHQRRGHRDAQPAAAGRRGSGGPVDGRGHPARARPASGSRAGRGPV
jgi:putative Mg2+ transporter-C (MgtC) family protein